MRLVFQWRIQDLDEGGADARAAERKFKVQSSKLSRARPVRRALAYNKTLSLVPSPSPYAVHVYVDNSGEHFETGSETSREVDVVLYNTVQVGR